MKTLKILALTLLLLGISLDTHAQAAGKLTATSTAHAVVLQWTDPQPGAFYIVSRAPCTGTFTPSGSNPNVGTCSQDGTPVTTFATTAINAITYTDSTAVGATVYDYYVQTTCVAASCAAPYTGAGPSVMSNEVAAQVPATIPPPPTLGITSVAEAIDPTGTTETVTAQWVDTTVPNIQDYFAFTNGATFLNQGLTSSPSGTFAQIYVGPVQPKMWFLVCNALGTCISAQAFPPHIVECTLGLACI